MFADHYADAKSQGDRKRRALRTAKQQRQKGLQRIRTGTAARSGFVSGAVARHGPTYTRNVCDHACTASTVCAIGIVAPVLANAIDVRVTLPGAHPDPAPAALLPPFAAPFAGAGTRQPQRTKRVQRRQQPPPPPRKGVTFAGADLVCPQSCGFEDLGAAEARAARAFRSEHVHGGWVAAAARFTHRCRSLEALLLRDDVLWPGRQEPSCFYDDGAHVFEEEGTGAAGTA